MINLLRKKYLLLYVILGLFILPFISFAQPQFSFDAQNLVPRAELFINSNNEDLIKGATFDVPIYINTDGNSINTVSVKLNFDQTRLSIVKPSGGKSILGIWLEPPSYDNKNGTASFVGVIPNGIVTESGLIATVTFKALATGEARINFTDYSSANLNDGVGSIVKLSLDGATFNISPKTPEGVKVYSDTHPFQDVWYINNSPVLNWTTPEGITGYNYLIDLNPNTIPETVIKDKNSSASYENLKDGVWYFHVRVNTEGVWGNTSHYQIRVDTNPPAFFAPVVDILKDNSSINKYMLSFITTDSLSGMSRYEVGVLDTSEENTASPLFVQSESPYIISNENKSSHVIIRAFDKAGNIREASIDLYDGIKTVTTIKKYALYLFMLFTFILLLELMLHYLFGHHIFTNIKKMFYLFNKISSDESKYKQMEDEINKVDSTTDSSIINKG